MYLSFANIENSLQKIQQLSAQVSLAIFWQKVHSINSLQGGGYFSSNGFDKHEVKIPMNLRPKTEALISSIEIAAMQFKPVSMIFHPF
jgi:hypothetical protein